MNRKDKIKHLKNTYINLSKMRKSLVVQSMVPIPALSLGAKLRLTMLDNIECELGVISPTKRNVKAAARFIPFGGLISSIFETGAEVAMEDYLFSTSELNSLTDEQINLLYSYTKEN